MSLHTKNKFTPLNHKDDLARSYQSVQSPKHCASPASNNYTTIGTRESPKRSSFSHTETQRFMSTPLINVQGVLSSSGNYKDKRPLEINDILDHDRPRSLNVSTPSAHNVTPKSNYDTHDTSALKASFYTNKTGSYKSEGKSPVLEIDSHFSSTKVYTTPQKSSNTTYLAEKVYSMKMKGVSHLTSIMPLSKTRSPGNFPLSTKNGSAVSNNSRNELKDNDIPSPTLSPMKSDGFYSHNERSYTSNMHEELSTPKKQGLSGQKSLGKLLNTTKSQNSTLKNNESLLLKGNRTPVKKSPVPEKKGFTEKSKQAPANTTNTSRTYRPGSGTKTPVKTRNVEILQARANRFVEKLSGVFWQINQRNKRVVLVNMLEILHQYQLRVTDYLEHKKLYTKSKYFCLWQEYLLEVNREKQRILQSNVEDKKMAIAAAFYNSKVLRKVFNKLQIYKLPEFKTQPAPQPQAQFFSKTPSKSPNTSRHPSVPSIYQTKSTTLNIPSQIKTSRTPQTPQTNLNKSKFLTTRDKSPNDSRGIIKPERVSTPKPSTYSPLSNRSQSVGKVLKEMNSTSMIVSGTRTPKTPATPSRGNTPQRQKKPVTGNVTPSKNNQKELNVPRFGKSVSMIQDPMESVDYTKVLQSPAKTPKGNDLDQSFGYKNANNSYEKGGEMFDSILAEILHVPESNNSHAIPSLSPFKQSQQQDTRRPNTSNDAYFSAVEAAKKTTVSSATVKRNNITPKTAVPPKTTRDYTPPKVNKTVSRDPSLTSRTRQEEKKKNEIIKKGITINSTPQKVTRNSGVNKSSLHPQQQQQQQKSFMQEDIEDREDEMKMQKAINHRRKTLLQNAFVWLLASYIQSSEELLEGMTKAQYHYENNLKIKGLSAFLENFVTSFKERQLLETELLSDEMHGGSAPKVESDENIYDNDTPDEEEEEDDTYDLIISRFRFIVLTEKAMRGFKQIIPPKKKKPVSSASKYRGKGY